MNPRSASRRGLLTISNVCCLLVVAFSGLVFPVGSATAALITSEQSMTSVQMRNTIEAGEPQLGGLSVWFDIGLSDPIAQNQMGCSSRKADPQSDVNFASSVSKTQEKLTFSSLVNMDFCVFSSSASIESGSASGLIPIGNANGHGGSIAAAILVPQMRFPVPVLNQFSRGADFLFVPPVVPDELLRPPQI